MSEIIPFFDEDQPSDELMRFVLVQTKNAGGKAVFVCPIGLGHVLMQRVRMRVSRLRKKLMQQGEIVAQFRLTTTIDRNPAAEQDKITVIRTVTDSNMLSEMLDKLEISKGLVDDNTF